jgi:hypothetical protein
MQQSTLTEVIPKTCPNINLMHIMANEFKSITNALTSKSSSGYDEIST